MYVPWGDGVQAYNGNFSTQILDDLTVNGEITATDDYEWRVTTSGVVNFSACLGQVNVKLETNHLTLSGIQDTTQVVAYNVPTVATLQRFSAQPAGANLLVTALLYGAFALLALAVYRWRKS